MAPDEDGHCKHRGNGQSGGPYRDRQVVRALIDGLLLAGLMAEDIEYIVVILLLDGFGFLLPYGLEHDIR